MPYMGDNDGRATLGDIFRAAQDKAKEMSAPPRREPTGGIAWAKEEMEHYQWLLNRGDKLTVIKLLREVYAKAYNAGASSVTPNLTPKANGHYQDGYEAGFHAASVAMIDFLLKQQRE